MRFLILFLFLSSTLLGQTSYTKEDIAGSWKIKKFQGADYVSDKILNFNAGEGIFSMHLCNSIQGNYSVSKKDKLSMNTTVSTKMFCMDDPTKESEVISALAKIDRLALNDTNLKLLAGKTVVLELERIITRTAPIKATIKNNDLEIKDYQPSGILLKSTKNNAKISIKDENGIGKMTVSPATKWRKNMVIELELKSLEHLSIEFNSEMHVDYSYNIGNGQSSKNWSVTDPALKLTVPAKNDINVTVSQTGTNKTFKITIPKKLLKNAETLQVKWIDFFRG